MTEYPIISGGPAAMLRTNRDRRVKLTALLLAVLWLLGTALFRMNNSIWVLVAVIGGAFVVLGIWGYIFTTQKLELLAEREYRLAAYEQAVLVAESRLDDDLSVYAGIYDLFPPVDTHQDLLDPELDDEKYLLTTGMDDETAAMYLMFSSDPVVEEDSRDKYVIDVETTPADIEDLEA